MGDVPTDAVGPVFCLENVEAVMLQGLDELVMVEAIFPWVFEKCAAKRLADEVAQDFFGIETAAWFKDTPDLREGGSPVRNMVDDAKIESSIIMAIRSGKMASIADPEVHGVMFQLAASQGNHCRIQIQGINMSGTELLENNLRSHASAAADFKHLAAGQGSPHFPKARSLEMPLDPGAHGVVHHHEFESV